MKRNFGLILGCMLALTVASCSKGPADGDYTLQILTTNDVHGTYFDSTYVSDKVKNSLFAIDYYVDSVRNAVGEDNVILLDVGDHLQGDNVAYYYNYVDTTSEHIWSRLMAYMKYDAVCVGNHDIETGHHVYDRLAKSLKSHGIPYLAGNAINNKTGKPWFDKYTVLYKGGLKVLVLGYTNPNMKAWLNESLWRGITFESLIPLVQKDVDELTAKVKPQVVIVACHSGVGPGDGSVLESQGMDLFKSLKGVDFLVCAHDHRPLIAQTDSICLINSGSHSRNVGHGTITVTIKDGKVVSKTLSADEIPVDMHKAVPAMEAEFHDDYLAVKAFTLRNVGELKSDLVTSKSYIGMCDYINFIQTLELDATGAQISFAAPLTYNGTVKAGELIYNDLFTIYPYENQLYVLNMKGSEIKSYLEYSYNNWIQTVSKPTDHVLNIVNVEDTRNGQKGWSFAGAFFNFDSAAGIDYTVDVTKPYGERITILSMADGTPFSMDETYSVAMTSYRASGGGDLLPKGAGIDAETAASRTTDKYKEIREIIYDYLQAHGSIDPAAISASPVLGHWDFIPEKLAGPALARDYSLMFGE